MKNNKIGQNLHGREILTAAEFQQMQRERTTPSNSKYGNTWVTIDGQKFQSQAEGKYFGKLKMRKLSGDIKDFKRHVTWKFFYNNVFITSYECDFLITENDGTETVVDVKSEETAKLYAFGIKKKMMKAFFNIDVKVAK